MSFVKLDRGILDSSLWSDRDQRDIFLTAILSAEPLELLEPAPQLDIGTLDKTGFLVPAGWYGFVAMAPSGLIRRSCLGATDGYKALEKLGRIDPDSRSEEFGGRRLARIASGFVLLNYVKYREKDHSSTERVRLYRQRVKSNSFNKSETMKHQKALHETDVTLHETYEDEYEDEDKFKSEHHVQSKRIHFSIPSLAEVTAYCLERGRKVDPQRWFDYYTANGWKVGRNAMKDWRAAVRNWESNGGSNGSAKPNEPSKTEQRVRKNREAILAGLGFGDQLGHGEHDLQDGNAAGGNKGVARCIEGTTGQDRK